jgi:hypothetical protein
MNISHLDLGPLLYCRIMFVGIAIMWFPLTSERWFSLGIDITVLFWATTFTVAR